MDGVSCSPIGFVNEVPKGAFNQSDALSSHEYSKRPLRITIGIEDSLFTRHPHAQANLTGVSKVAFVDTVDHSLNVVHKAELKKI